MDYSKAISYWDEKDKSNKVMGKEDLLKWADEFFKEHNTIALATASKDYIDNTPLEYNYIDGKIYILTEGGHKFIGLKENKNIAATVFEDYKNFGKIKSTQIYGVCELVETGTDEYYKVTDSKNIPRNMVGKINLYLLRLDIKKLNILCSDFKKDGFSNRQTIDF